MKPILGAVLIGVAGAAQAVELTLPTGAHQMITRDTAQDRFLAPVGVFRTEICPIWWLRDRSRAVRGALMWRT